MNDDGSLQADAMKSKTVSNEDQDILNEMKKRFVMCTSAEGENQKQALDDLRFLTGDQWPEKQRRSRESEGRPCLTINKLPTFLQQVTNDQRQNRSSIKVSAVSENASSKVAELIQGMIRNIEYESSADVAYDTAINSAASIGFGYFRIITEYSKEDSFDQDIRIKRIRNSFTVHGDPASQEPDGSDSQFWIISEKMTRDEFKARYPKAEITNRSFETGSTGDSSQNWMWESMVRVAEYYRIEFTPAKLYLLSDGTTSYENKDLLEGVKVVNTRDTVKKKVMHYLATPCEILTRTEIMCRWIPVFPVYGTEIDVDGKVYRAGLVRNAKDPAMMYNYWMTSATEEVSLRPKTPYIGAEGQFMGHEKKWAQANNRSFAYLEYKPVGLDGQIAPAPQRQPMVDVPVGVLTMANHASDNIKSTTGLFDSSLGAQGNATSGKQEMAQQRQGNVANFHYADNFMKTLRQAGRCLINMIPHYIDTERLIKTRGEDGTSSFEHVNKYDAAAGQIINDLTVGEYETAVTTGPSYATMRAEAADSMVQFGQSWPKLMDIAGDKVVKAMNWPGAEEIAERIARTIPPEIRDEPGELDENGQPKPPTVPPAIQQKIQEMEKEIESLTREADKNHANVTIAEIRKEALEQSAYITAESRADVEELKGMVQLLLAKISPPPQIVDEVTENFNRDSGVSQTGELQTNTAQGE